MNSGFITAYIGLGANLGAPLQQFRQALRLLASSAGITLTRVSNVYRSAALEHPSLPAQAPRQPDYLNMAVQLRTYLPARWLLRKLLDIERKLGRTRERRWGPRVLDLDLLLYDQQRLRQPDFVLPHPEIHKRAFVLYPLRDITRNLTIPGQGPLQRLLACCDRDGLVCLSASELLKK